MQVTDGFENRSSFHDPILFQLITKCNVSDFGRYMKMGADPNVTNNKGLSILTRVILLNFKGCDLDAVRSEFARILIDAGADFDLADESGESLLLLSLRQGRSEIARLLVKLDGGIAWF